jgi:hypothetical protein
MISSIIQEDTVLTMRAISHTHDTVPFLYVWMTTTIISMLITLLDSELNLEHCYPRDWYLHRKLMVICRSQMALECAGWMGGSHRIAVGDMGGHLWIRKMRVCCQIPLREKLLFITQLLRLPVEP